MVEEAHDPAPAIWVHQESAVVDADTHDVWSFTPEFLLVDGIVPETWSCRRASREPAEADIDYGPTNWRMTENQLWISVYPDVSVSEWHSLPEASLIPSLAQRYLERVPYLPFERAFFYWNVSTLKTDQLSRMVENMLPSDWPEEFKTLANQTQPLLQFTSENHNFQITMQDRAVEREGSTFDDSIVFNCHAFPSAEQPLDRAITEMGNWAARWRTLQRAIQHLTGEMEPNA